MTDWSRTFSRSAWPAAGLNGPAGTKSQSFWLRRFLLDLGADILDPKSDLEVVLPGFPDQQGNSGRGGRTGASVGWHDKRIHRS